jgi:hypothetical protein
MDPFGVFDRSCTSPRLWPIAGSADFGVRFRSLRLGLSRAHCKHRLAGQTYQWRLSLLIRNAAKEGCVAPILNTLQITTARNSGWHILADTSIVPKQIKIIPNQSSPVIFSRRKSQLRKRESRYLILRTDKDSFLIQRSPKR